MERFWNKVEKTGSDDCWEWQASTINGYGQFDKGLLSHRVAYRLEVEDPGENYVLHKCDNKLCVNPEHLYLGDQQDNMNDAVERGQMPSGENAGPAKLTNEEVEEIRSKLEDTDLTQKEIGEQYGVTQPIISDISNGKIW